MICVTGRESTLDALAARLHRIDGHDVLHEVRADHLQHIDDDLFSLIEREGERVLFCCRPHNQGGAFAGSEAERLALLHRATDARWVDVEHDAPLDGFDLDRVVLSWHDFECHDDVIAQARSLAERRPAVVKLAARVEDARHLGVLLGARREIPGDAVLIAMGPAGLLSRVRYGALGSRWTYVAAEPELCTAPGQLSYDDAVAMGLPGTAGAPFCALIGGLQVLGSPGTRVYNALYRELGLELSYLPIVTRSLSACWPLLSTLAVRGLSVTMPLKDEALALCEADALATNVGSVNSMRNVNHVWEGTNTDVEGVRAPLAEAGVAGRALVLGAGGAARAAAHACRMLALDVTISARSPRGLTDVVPWDARSDIAHDVLINATPIAGATSPWPDDAPLAGCVFDLAIADGSALLDRAEREGSVAIDARRMWLHQGAQQMSWMLDVDLTAEQLEEHL